MMPDELWKTAAPGPRDEPTDPIEANGPARDEELDSDVEVEQDERQVARDADVDDEPAEPADVDNDPAEPDREQADFAEVDEPSGDVDEDE